MLTNCCVHFQTDNGVGVCVPDTPQLHHFGLVGYSQTVQRVEEALEFFNGGQTRIMNDGKEGLFCLLLDPFDECFQQRLTRIKVVMECSTRNLYLVQNILNRHLLISLSKHEPLGGIQNLSALRSNCFRFGSASHWF